MSIIPPCRLRLSTDRTRFAGLRLTATGLLLAPLMGSMAGCQSQPVVVPGASMPSLVSQARAADAAGQSARAEQLYRQVATIDPSNSIARRRLADFARTADFDTQLADGSDPADISAPPADPERFDRDALAAAEAEAIRAFGLIESQLVDGPVAEARRGAGRQAPFAEPPADAPSDFRSDDVAALEPSPEPAPEPATQSATQTIEDSFADFLASAGRDPAPVADGAEPAAVAAAPSNSDRADSAAASEPAPAVAEATSETQRSAVEVELLDAPPPERPSPRRATRTVAVAKADVSKPSVERSVERSGGSAAEAIDDASDADLFAEFLAQADPPASETATEPPAKPAVPVQTISQSTVAPLVRINANQLATTLREAPASSPQRAAVATPPSRRIVSPAVRAIDALWERWQAGGDSPTIAAKLSDQLTSATRSENVEAETAALAALGQMGPDAAGVVPMLQQTLVAAASSDPLSLRAVRAADAILQIDPADRVANRAMQVVIKTGTGSQRVAAATALGRADDSAVPFLRRTLRDPSEPVRAAAALALARQGRSAIRVVDDLREVATFDTPVVRQAAHVAIDRITR